MASLAALLNSVTHVMPAPKYSPQRSTPTLPNSPGPSHSISGFRKEMDLGQSRALRRMRVAFVTPKQEASLGTVSSHQPPPSYQTLCSLR